MSIGTAVLIVTLTGFLAAVMLVIAAKLMYVEEDPRIGEVQAVLPGANCGACGYAGCADYAKAIVEGAPTNLCVPGGAQAAADAAAVMGVEALASAAKKAVVMCQGSCANVKTKYDYEGVGSCAAVAALFQGDSACSFGCLGYGDCVAACPFDAIKVVDGVAKVDQAKCTGCGACAAVCPKKIIKVDTEYDLPVVPEALCRNTEKGGVVRKICTVGCIGCGICAKNCPMDCITVKNNLATIDHTNCVGCGKCIDVCPTKCIQPVTSYYN